MASRWRDWDIDFKDNVIPTGQSVIANHNYREAKQLDQSDLPPVSVPGDLLELIERECESRRKEDCIVVSSARNGDNYLYTRDGELRTNLQEYRCEEQELTVHPPSSPPSSPPPLHSRDRGSGVGRAQLMRQRADKATALAGNKPNEPPKKSIGRGRGKSKTNPE